MNHTPPLQSDPSISNAMSPTENVTNDQSDAAHKCRWRCRSCSQTEVPANPRGEIEYMLDRFVNDDSQAYSMYDKDDLIWMMTMTPEEEARDLAFRLLPIQLYAFSPIALSPHSAVQLHDVPDFAITSTIPARLLYDVCSDVRATDWTIDDNLLIPGSDPAKYHALKKYLSTTTEMVLVKWVLDFCSPEPLGTRLLLSRGLSEEVARRIMLGNVYNAIAHRMEHTAEDLELWHFSGGMECVAASLVSPIDHFDPLPNQPVGMIDKSLVSASMFELLNISAIQPLKA